ncbi:hypothetical protein GCM10020256_01750 [Streptomyces thermocoprophilus]
MALGLCWKADVRGNSLLGGVVVRGERGPGAALRLVRGGQRALGQPHELKPAGPAAADGGGERRVVDADAGCARLVGLGGEDHSGDAQASGGVLVQDGHGGIGALGQGPLAGRRCKGDGQFSGGGLGGGAAREAQAG